MDIPLCLSRSDALLCPGRVRALMDACCLLRFGKKKKKKRGDASRCEVCSGFGMEDGGVAARLIRRRGGPVASCRREKGRIRTGARDRVRFGGPREGDEQSQGHSGDFPRRRAVSDRDGLTGGVGPTPPPRRIAEGREATGNGHRRAPRQPHGGAAGRGSRGGSTAPARRKHCAASAAQPVVRSALQQNLLCLLPSETDRKKNSEVCGVSLKKKVCGYS